MKRLFLILAISLASTGIAYAQAPTKSEVQHVLKLTKKHLPISLYFTDDDNDDDYYTANHTVLFRRQTAIKAKTDITPSDDDYVISDAIRARLMLARVRALQHLS
jgi:hypothetical protein